MSTVTIKFMPHHMMALMYSQHVNQHVRTALRDRLYTSSEPFEVAGDGLEAAEEAFDLTNNPSRQEERERVYGRGRSLSVGDIVVTNKGNFLCKSFGWEAVLF